jgi:putative nucleotidyltransferase-like protein
VRRERGLLELRHESIAESELWTRVEKLVDGAPSLGSLRAHRLELAAARIQRARGVSIAPELRREQHQAAFLAMSAPMLLERARSAYDGELLLLKGPEVAARYAEPSDRFFRDLDLLAEDAPAAQRALIAAGFVEYGDPAAYEREQHLCPLVWPGIPLVVEVHRHANAPSWLPRLHPREILGTAVPSATGVRGLLAPSPAVHALLLVAHSWAHHPLARLRDLVDLAVVLVGEDRCRVREIAREWGWEGIWRVSEQAIDDVFAPRHSHPPSFMARHLPSVRERSVLENHLSRLAAPVCALPAGRVPRAFAGVLADAARRHRDEPWRDKLNRARLSLAHAFMSTSSHEQTLPPRSSR